MSHTVIMESNALAETDEMAMAQELVLKSLSKRKALLLKQRQGMEHNLGKHRLELTRLQSNEAALKLARLKHIKLQKEIEQKLLKSEERLKQFPAHVVEQIAKEGDPDNGSDASKSDKSLVDKDEVMVDTSLHDDDEEAVGDGDGVSNNDTTTNAHDCDLQPLKSLDDDPSMLVASIENPFAGKTGVLSLFQIKQNSRHLALHPMVHGQRLEKMMELATHDFSSMDVEDHEGNHRREALYHTCLLPFPVVKWELDGFVDHVRKDDPDPDYPFCPYEMTGDCRDPFCLFEHFKERKVESKRLIKELIPLPDLAISLLGSSRRHWKKRSLDEEKDARMLMPQKKVKGINDTPMDNYLVHTAPPSEISQDTIGEASPDKPKEEFLDTNHDFVFLPEGDLESDKATNDQGPLDCWWMDEDDQERIREVWRAGKQVTLLTWVKTVFGIDELDGFLVCRKPCQTLDDQLVLRLLGRLVNVLQLSLHSGRYDFGKSACRMLEKLCLRYSNVFPCQQLQTFFASWSQSWKMNNHKRNIFAVALAQQTLLFSINHFLSLLDRHKTFCSSSGQCDDPDFSAKWADVLTRIIAKPESHCQTSKEFQEQSRMKCTQVMNDTNDEKLVFRATATRMLALAEFVALTEDLAGQSFSLQEVNGLLDTIRTTIKQQQRDSGAELRSMALIGSLTTGVEQALGEVGVTPKATARLEYKLDRLCSSIYGENDLPKTDLMFLLTPVFALRVSLLVSTRRYDKAQRALEGYLGRNLCVVSFSDLLWSQMIMLRSILPTRRKVARNAANDPVSIDASTVVSGLGVKLNFLTLVGDRTLFYPFRKSDIDKKRRIELQANVTMFMHQIQMLEGVEEVSPLVKMLDLDSMPMGSATNDQETSDAPSPLTFPRSLLLGGYVLRRLKLSHCQIEVLPPIFGEHFPILQELTLDNNRLTALPSSIGNITSLIILDASHNELTSLPDTLGECLMLEQLLVQENRILSLPEEIGRCSKLRRVDLKNNCLETTPVDLVCRVDSLVYLDLEGNPCNAVVRGML